MGCTTSQLTPTIAIRGQSGDKMFRKSQNLSVNVVIENFDRSINEFYDMKETVVLGTGVNGKVIECVHKATKLKYALKSLNKMLIKSDKMRQLREEINILSQLDHPNIIRLHEYFESKNDIKLVMEQCRGGELLDRLHSQDGHHYSEKIARNYVRTICGAISYCHKQNIVHRDLKLENFLFETEAFDSALKLIDFGLSQHFDVDTKLHKAVGTPYYVSPDVLQGSYDEKCDVWSIGVIAYMLLSGTPPFYGKDDNDTLTSVRSGRWKFHEALFKNISTNAKDFIRQCLTKSPEKRPSSHDLLDHPWFQLISSSSSSSAELSLEVIVRLRGYSKKSALTKLCIEVVAHTLRFDQISELRDEFMKVDAKQLGLISSDDMKKVLRSFYQFNEVDLEILCDEIGRSDTGMIQYHEFIAAALSRRIITDENILLAFEKISNHRSYITVNDISHVFGVNVSSTDMAKMLSEVGLSKNECLDFDKFKSIMMGGPATPVLVSPYAIHLKQFSFIETDID